MSDERTTEPITQLASSSLTQKLRRVFRGEVDAATALKEASRRIAVKSSRRRERAHLVELDRQPAGLREEFARIRSADLLAHFLTRAKPQFFPGFQDLNATAQSQKHLSADETAILIHSAQRICHNHCWPLLGFGEKCFGREEIEWNRDPLSNLVWPLAYHADINLMRQDGSDARVLWELNRLSHLITLGRAYAVSRADQTAGQNPGEEFAEEFFRQIASWRKQNPVARGVNWNCAMEVALRAMNLLAAFTCFLHAPQMTPEALKEILQMLDHHGAHIRRNLEFSHIATSNHYLADITGLLWLGIMLPELQAAQEWQEFALRELLNELEKQVLPDGTDYEASTGYHRLKLELFLYSFVLCHVNDIDIPRAHWQKLQAMMQYVRAYLRPDGHAPLIGDSDSGQVLPIVRRSADDHSYLLAVGAAVFQEPKFKTSESLPPELLWILGPQSVRDFINLHVADAPPSKGFADGGIYVLRQGDLYLLFNATDSGVKGRGSHGHNDALSIEVSACGTAFIVDPGTYLYTADLHERHVFRSTAYHSTVQVDGVEQNSIDALIPFVIGNEARPGVLNWESGPDEDRIVAEHFGYRRLAQPVMHRRSVRFDKRNRFWLVEDQLTGEGTHEIAFRFHFAPGLDTKTRSDGLVEVWDKKNGSRLIITARKINGDDDLVTPVLESKFSSRDYGSKEASIAACWTKITTLPLAMHFTIVPVCVGEDEAARLRLAVN